MADAITGDWRKGMLLLRLLYDGDGLHGAKTTGQPRNDG